MEVTADAVVSLLLILSGQSEVWCRDIMVDAC
jgi:hypothetical protein